MSKETIVEALLSLDIENDEHWTQDGLPRIDALGIDALTRSDLTDAAPSFTRENPKLEAQEEDTSTEEDTDIDFSLEEEEEEKDTTLEGMPAPEEEEEAAPEEPLESREELAVQRVETQKGIASAQKVLSKAEKALEAAVAADDVVITKLEKLDEGHTAQHSIMHFINSQKQLRARKARAYEKLMDGVDAESVQPAPIDRAMARKNTRGTKRPVRPMMNK